MKIGRKRKHLYLHSKIATGRCEPGAATQTLGSRLICETKNLSPITVQAPFGRKHFEDVLSNLVGLPAPSEADVSIGFAKNLVSPIETIHYNLSTFAQVDPSGFEGNPEVNRELADEFTLSKALLS